MQLSLALVFAGAALAQKFAPTKPSPGTQVDSPPQLGFGTWYLKGQNATEAVASAIQAGYRHIDGAKIYNNQREVGAGIKEGLKRAGIDRKDLWITSKLWNNRHGDAAGGLAETLRELGLDYLDLYLVHWPQGNSTGRDTLDYVTAWKGMEQLVGKGTRFIGISNFSPAMLDDLLKNAQIKPKAHQIELHPYLQQHDFVASHYQKGIESVIAYAPLGNTNPVYTQRNTKLLAHPIITEIAQARGCTPAQVTLAWNLKRGVIVIPKAAQVSHQNENIATEAKCALQDEDVAKIRGIKEVARLNSGACMAFNYKCFEGLEGGR